MFSFFDFIVRFAIMLFSPHVLLVLFYVYLFVLLHRSCQAQVQHNNCFFSCLREISSDGWRKAAKSIKKLKMKWKNIDTIRNNLSFSNIFMYIWEIIKILILSLTIISNFTNNFNRFISALRFFFIYFQTNQNSLIYRRGYSDVLFFQVFLCFQRAILPTKLNERNK